MVENIPVETAMDEMKPSSRGTIMILFSSGLDSTTLLLNALNDNYSVDLLYVRGNQSQYKIEVELLSVYRIVEECKRQYGHLTINVIESKSRFDEADEWYDPDVSFVQPIQWFYPAVMFLRRHHTAIWLGYNSGDQFACHLEDLRLAWNTVLKFSKTYHVPIDFPLKYKDKKSMLHAMPAAFKLLIWVCEVPEKHSDVEIGRNGYKACGRCPACIRLAMETIAMGDPWMFRNYHRAVGIDPMQFLDFLNEEKKN